MTRRHGLIFAILLLLGSAAHGGDAPASTAAPAPATAATTDTPRLQRFVIEREIPGAGRMTVEQLRDAAAKSNQVLRALGPDIQWVQSYVTGDKLFCVYNAPSADLIRLHAERSGFPANKITPVTAVIDPTTAKESR